MMRFFSRFHRRYFRSLVYMLQASEYNLHDYFAWFARVTDFRTVEKRKTVVWTAKARTLYGALCVFSAVVSLAVIVIAWHTPATALLVALASLVFDALIAPYALGFATLVANALQRPLENRLIAKAKQKLAGHKGLKIAIAGSYGKTSMREILRTVLSEGKKVAAPPGSFNTPLGIVSFIDSLEGGEDVLVFELGEYYPGDIRKLCEFVEPQWGIITGVNEAHLEKFGTLEQTAATIFELADYIGEGVVYVNAENAAARERAAASHILFSRERVESPEGEWRIVRPETNLRGTSFALIRGVVAIHAHSRLLGLHMVGPLAAAADIASRVGLTTQEIEDGIKKTAAFDHRLQPIVD
ncbi:MAG: hypothetical protein JO019_01820, partial [Candidatus Kaiserbacteria bacterium]|nr:hypothetical protein [Candidatus Kaiserbacteria bacterium]